MIGHIIVASDKIRIFIDEIFNDFEVSDKYLRNFEGEKA